MKKILVIISFFSFTPHCIYAQQKTYCDTIIKQAYFDLNRDSIKLALEKLNYAERCDYSNSLLEARKKLQTDIFIKIENQKNTLNAFISKYKSANKKLNNQYFALKNKQRAIDSLYKAAINQAYRNAPSEYARLINDGPSEVNNNQSRFFDSSYLLAYSQHFYLLKNLIDSIEISSPNTKNPVRDTTAIKIYNSISNKLYYNNELYQRVYTAFERIEKNDTGNMVIKKADSLNFTSVKKENTFVIKHFKSLKKIKSSAENKYPTINFCYTDDNYINVFGPGGLNDTICMGARVTALDYDEAEKIIYFGTAGGYIGYIKYSSSGHRYQPVFENKLESEITAIRFFDYTDSSRIKNHFLLSVAKTSNSVLYRLDSILKEEKLLIGNILPYKKDFGEVEYAVVNVEYGRIIFKTKLKEKTDYYSWNPFTYNLLPKLKEVKNFKTGLDNDDLSVKTRSLMAATKVY